MNSSSKVPQCTACPPLDAMLGSAIALCHARLRKTESAESQQPRKCVPVFRHSTTRESRIVVWARDTSLLLTLPARAGPPRRDIARGLSTFFYVHARFTAFPTRVTYKRCFFPPSEHFHARGKPGVRGPIRRAATHPTGSSHGRRVRQHVFGETRGDGRCLRKAT